MDKPGDVFDRHQEWADLADFVSGPSVTSIGVVHGRRRQGKSWLLRRTVRATGGIYTMALQGDRVSALDRFGDAVARASGLPKVRIRPDDWGQALTAAGQVLTRTGHQVLVIDELPYLLTHSPELPSVIQAFYDDTTNDPQAPPLKILLCGSAISIMESLLSGGSPLRGRATLDMRIQPFDFRTAAAFWEIADPDVAFHVHAILGGTPGYRSLVQRDPPETLTGLSQWLASTVLNPASALFTEDDYLLRENPRIQDRSVYYAILGAVATGHGTPTKIGGAIGRDRTALAHPLDVLVSAGFLTSSRDVRKQRGAVYRIVDPIVRFHQLITRRRLSQLEERRADQAWSDARPTFQSQILGPHFEDLSRRWVRRHADPATTGGQVGEVGYTVVADRSSRAGHEVDVVALAAGERLGRKDSRIIAIGEAKASDRPRTWSDLVRLERIRNLLVADGSDCADARLLLFGRSGFTPDLHGAAATRADVELIDLDRLYNGT